MAEKKTKIRPVQENNKAEKKAAPKKNSGNKSFLMNKIPFKSCYEECGIIESAPGTYTVSYKVHVKDQTEDKTIEELRNGLREVFVEIARDFSFQIFIQNHTIQIGNFLDNIHLQENKEEKINSCIRAYNNMIDDNAEIGHNNYERSVFVVLSTSADMVDDAIAKFQELDAKIVRLFKEKYGYDINRQTIEDRLETIYSLFHPDEEATFASKKEEGTPIKSVLCPETYRSKETTYLQVGNRYAKTLFVNSFPPVVSHTLLNDLMATCSNSVLSIACVPIDTKLGQQVAAAKVLANTDSREIKKRDSVEDRKYKRTEIRIERKRENEVEYFYEQAKQELDEAVANNDVMLMTSFLITLFAETLEELERNAKLLSMSAAKFAIQIKECEDFQDAAFLSVFPVCNTKVDIARFLSSATVATMQPLKAKSVFSNTYSFVGLNSISDNFVLINRDLCRVGIICGIKNSGKSFTVKHSALNCLMNSNDEVLILTKNMKPYQNFVEKVGGSVYQSDHPDFYMLSEDEKLKRVMLEAFMVNSANLHIKKISAAKRVASLANMEKEANELSTFKTWNEAARAINSNKQQFSAFMTAMREYSKGFKKEADFLSSASRFNVIEIGNDADLVVMLAAALKYIHQKELEGSRVNLFVDGIDGLFYSDPGSAYLCLLVDEIKKTRSVATFVVQDTVRVLANDDAAIEFNYFIENKNEYFHLLAQGPIERKNFADRLNIPASLMAYLIDREPGEGIIITPAENVAFNNRFEKQTNEFYSLFYI